MEGRAAAVAVDVTGAAQAEGTGYTARFDGEHLSFTRTGALPAKGENVSFAFALSRVRLGAQAFSFEEPEVGVEENRAFAGRVAGLREEYVFLDTVVKQSFTLSRSLGATAGKHNSCRASGQVRQRRPSVARFQLARPPRKPRH